MPIHEHLTVCARSEAVVMARPPNVLGFSVWVGDADAVQRNPEVLGDAPPVDDINDVTTPCLDHGDVGGVMTELLSERVLAGSSGLPPRPNHHP
jgi:hypothetical protein